MTASAMCRLETAETATVLEAIDGDTLRLIDGRQVRLVGIQAPKLALGRKNFADWPLAEEAKAALDRLAKKRKIALGYGGLKIDRNGRLLAHVYVENVWLQGEMISTGMARVYTWPDNRSCAAELLAREEVAREGKLGIWALPFYRIRNPRELAGEIDTFQIVEGKVVGAADVRGRLFLNFGRDYKQDFTVTIGADDMKRFKTAGLDPRTLLGRVIRIRGWLSLLNGPEIEATHPEQIEILH